MDRRFLNVQLLVDSVANTPASTSAQYIVGSEPSGAFQGAAPNSIAYYDSENERWIFIAPGANVLEVFNVSTKEFLRWDGNSWAVKVSLEIPTISQYVFETFHHKLTQKEIENKTFDMRLQEGYNITGVSTATYMYIALFLNGVRQYLLIDFDIVECEIASGYPYFGGNYPFYSSDVVLAECFSFKPTTHYVSDIQYYQKIAIKWEDKGLENIDIRKGDLVTLQLIEIS